MVKKEIPEKQSIFSKKIYMVISYFFFFMLLLFALEVLWLLARKKAVSDLVFGHAIDTTAAGSVVRSARHRQAYAEAGPI
jgi:hypothetical protein